VREQLHEMVGGDDMYIVTPHGYLYELQLGKMEEKQ
jgi:hypothetical protein